MSRIALYLRGLHQPWLVLSAARDMDSRHIITPLPTYLLMIVTLFVFHYVVVAVASSMFLSCCFVMIFWYPLMNSTLGNMPSPPFDCSFVVVMGVLLLHRRFTRPPPSVKYVDEASPEVISVFTLGNPIPPILENLVPLLSLCPTRNLHPWKLPCLPPASDRLC